MFATRAHVAGEVVGVCAVLMLHTTRATIPDDIRRYVFSWAVLAQVPGTRALALGFGSLYNHNNPANLRYHADAELGLPCFKRPVTLPPTKN